MPKRRAPRASRKKTWLHTFYLIQPFVQFFALMATVLFLARCSPLSPSTDKSSTLQANALGDQSSAQAELAAQEEAIQKSLKEVSQMDLSVLEEPKLAALDAAIHSDLPFTENEVISHFESKYAKSVAGKSDKKNILLLKLSEEKAVAFFREGSLRLDLASLLKNQSDEASRRVLFQNLSLSLADKELKASLVLVLPKGALQQNKELEAMKLPVFASYGTPSENQAFMEIRIRPQSEEQKKLNAMLLESALPAGSSLALLLE